MRNPGTGSAFVQQASTAVLLAVAACGAGACTGDRPTVEARTILGSRLGAAHPASSAAQAASADDLSAAQRYLEATLRVDPSNEAARAALATLGGVAPDDVDLPFADPDRIAGPVASRAAPGRGTPSLSSVAFGDVGALGSDVAVAVRPWANAGAAMAAAGNVGAPPTATDSAEALATLVGARTLAADSAARAASASEQTSRGQPTRARTPGDAQVRFGGRTVAVRRRDRARERVDAALAAREDRLSAADSALGVADAGGATRPKHQRTWPWTRAQRWLVAKGIGAGGGAGVVVGAIIGNVPGALIAGSLGGGALGFKKATKIGPAAPYPTPSDSVRFETEKREKAKADTARRVAAKP